MNTPLSRRTALQAAGATAVAVGLSGGLTATAAHADENKSAQRLVTYPRPAAMPTNTSFKVRVRTAPDGEWQTLDIYRPQLEEINTTTGSGKVYNSSMVYFDFCGSAELEVTCLKGGTTKARVRPDALGITPELLGDTLRFTLDEPKDVVVQINDEIFECLHVITNRVDPHPPAADDPDVIYFGPGVHTVTGGVLTVPSGKTVHLAGGAVLQAQIYFKDVAKAALTGHGMLNAGPGGAILCEGSRNIRVQDVIIMNPNGYAGTFAESANIHVKRPVRSVRRATETGSTSSPPPESCSTAASCATPTTASPSTPTAGTTTATPVTSPSRTAPCGPMSPTPSTSARTATPTTRR